ncbi:VOC family protein [Candidatus Woesearchaeota archaeon]|nr:VOC family protein [Candidatus Woesearchaeota archaeon]
MKQKIVPCLWLDNEAEEAAEFYTSRFKGKILSTAKYLTETPSDKPIGSVMTVTFEINNMKLMALNGGPFFKINPSISISVQCETEQEIDDLYKKLSNEVLMPLQNYGFSKKFGWVRDKFGLSWQLNLPENYKEVKQKICMFLMFTKDVCGKAEEAMNLYIKLFKNSKIEHIFRYSKDRSPEKEGNVEHAVFSLSGQEFMALDSSQKHDFTFSEAVSLMIYCKGQDEIDYFYNNLSANKEAEVCGWLKDKYGVSWQLITEDFEKLTEKNGEKVMETLLKMKRIDIRKLKMAAEGK